MKISRCTFGLSFDLTFKKFALVINQLITFKELILSVVETKNRYNKVSFLVSLFSRRNFGTQFF